MARSALLVAGLTLFLASARAAEAQQPNILFILSDDHAAHALSAYRAHLKYGAHLPDTPNLDRLAADGMLFTNAFVTNSICGPSRATVLTGQYGHLNGVMTNNDALHPTHTTFPALLHAGGAGIGQQGLAGGGDVPRRDRRRDRTGQLVPGQGGRRQAAAGGDRHRVPIEHLHMLAPGALAQGRLAQGREAGAHGRAAGARVGTAELLEVGCGGRCFLPGRGRVHGGQRQRAGQQEQAGGAGG